MSNDKIKISVAGNIILDKILSISSYPEKGRLETVLDIKSSVGGCVPNTLIDLAKMDKTLKLSAYGRVGNDADGAFILNEMSACGIDISHIKTAKSQTSFTTVIQEKGGERTFFQYRGANAEFCGEDIDLNSLDCDIFHFGYLLLLDAFDVEGVMPSFLRAVQKKGIKTSVDVVSENSNRFFSIVAPCLPYLDYLIINETEAGQIANINPRKNGKIDSNAVKEILTYLTLNGVKTAIIHCPEAGFMLRDGNYSIVPSLELPKSYIKGTVGAGDAFCAGCLYALSKGFSDTEVLEFASMSAAANLSSEDSVGGARARDEIIKLGLMFSRKGGNI